MRTYISSGTHRSRAAQVPPLQDVDRLGFVGAGPVPPVTVESVTILSPVQDRRESVMKRKRIRLRYFDYRRTGIYFVTVCTHGRKSTLGTIRDGETQLSRLGRLAASRWESIPKHAPNADLDHFVVMPNHVHGLIGIDTPGIHSESKRESGELRGGSLGAVVGGFKASVTRIGRADGIVSMEPVWQRGFWEHIVRGPEALERIRCYIVENPSRWYCDAENRERRGDDPFDAWIDEQGVVPR